MANPLRVSLVPSMVMESANSTPPLFLAWAGVMIKEKASIRITEHKIKFFTIWHLSSDFQGYPFDELISY
jgi:hypothetical protein